MNRLYTPPNTILAAFGFRQEPEVVKVLEWDNVRGMARCECPVGERSIINLMRKKDGSPPLKTTVRWLPIADLKEVSSEP